MIFTYGDAYEHGIDFLGGTPDALAQRDVRRSCQEAYQELVNSRTWSYLFEHGRILLNPAYQTGTVVYDHTGGAHERQLTLTGGAFPTWVGPGSKVRIGVVTSDILERISGTVCTLALDVNPGQDVASSSFTLYHDDYALPEDFLRTDTAIFEGNFGGLTFAAPTDQLWFQRFTYSAGTPRFYTIRGSTLFPGRMVIGFFPYPDATKTIDFIYQRSSRLLRWQQYDAGTITCDGTTAVVGNGVIFDQSMAGSILRLGTRTLAPTSLYSTNPASAESLVTEVVSDSELRTADAMPSLASAKYTISDPIDVDQQIMLTAYRRGIEKWLAIARRMTFENQPSPMSLYQEALRDAQSADSRSFQGRAMGPQRSRWIAPKYMPANFFPT